MFNEILVHHDEETGATSVTIRMESVGVSRCSDEDAWSEFEGEYHAFERAVAKFPREIRQSLWDAFWTKHPNEDPRDKQKERKAA